MTAPFLVFGYGSLIWRPPPHVAQRIPGYITTHLRRFWQLSQDHRGTVESPGRVVTLIPRAEVEQYNKTSAVSNQGPAQTAATDDAHDREADRCWGVVYEIVPESVDEVTAYLTQREINGYSRLEIPVHTTHGILNAFVFIGESDNPQYSPYPDDEVGMRAIAEHIARSQGPSGRNDEYLFNLETSLKDLQRQVSLDEHHQGSQISQSHHFASGDWYVEELVKLVKSVQCETAK